MFSLIRRFPSSLSNVSFNGSPEVKARGCQMKHMATLSKTMDF